MLEQTLAALGLSEKEITLFLTVLQQGKITPAEAAHITGLNRSTVYALAKDLDRKKFLLHEQGEMLYLTARSPDDWDGLLQEERAKFHQREHLLKTAATELEPYLKGKQYGIPRTRFVDEKELEKYLYERTEEWVKGTIAKDRVWRGFQDHSFVEEYTEYLDWSWKQPFSKNLRLEMFTNDSIAERLMNKKIPERRAMKHWKQGEVTASTWICGDSVVMISTRKRPHYLFEIQDPLMAENQRRFFKAMWEII